MDNAEFMRRDAKRFELERLHCNNDGQIRKIYRRRKPAITGVFVEIDRLAQLERQEFRVIAEHNMPAFQSNLSAANTVVVDVDDILRIKQMGRVWQRNYHICCTYVVPK